MTQPSGSARLVVTGPTQFAGRIMVFSQPDMLIGRDENAHFVFDDAFLNRRHARVNIDSSGAVTITDLGSVSGTFVNDERLTGSRLLRAGDKVGIGDIVAQFVPSVSEPASDSHTEIIEVAQETIETAVSAAPGTESVEPSSAAASGSQKGDAPAIESERSEISIEVIESDTLSPGPLVTTDGDSERRFMVSGKVTWTDGSPAAGMAIRAVDRDLRKEQPLGPHAPRFAHETRSDVAGRYEIVYTRSQFAHAEIKTADLIVRALDANGGVAAISPTMFNAPENAEINLTLAGAVAGQPSEYERLIAVVSPLLRDADPPDVTSLQSTDLDFLTSETEASQTYLSNLLTAVSFYQDTVATLSAPPSGTTRAANTLTTITSPDLLVPAFYGLLREDLSASWAGLLQSGEETINTTLISAVNDGIVPATVGQNADQIATQLTGIAASQALTPAGGGATVASALLGAASLSSEQQQTLITAAANTTTTPQEFWASLSSQPGFDAPTVAHLQLTLQLGLLTGSNIPLVQTLLAQPSVSSVKDLVSMNSTAWAQLLSAPVDGQAIPIPAGVPGATLTDQLNNYAQYLSETVQSALPNETIAHLVATNVITTDSNMQAAIGQFFTNATDFDIRTTRITSYVAANGSTAFAGVPAATKPSVVSQLQRLQRAFQISVSADSMTTLMQLGLDAAHLVANIPPQSFSDRFATALGGTDTAQAIHQRATYINARSVGLIAQLNETINGVTAPGLIGRVLTNGGTSPQEQILAQYPDYAELFGALDSCTCEECTSVISPAAYLVDMLQFLGGTTPNTFVSGGSSSSTAVNPQSGNTPLDVLIGGGQDQSGNPLPGRRPDLQYLKLTCENTNTELPYIDLVNEVMESYILYNGPTQYAAHDTGDTTTIELDASPQFMLDQIEYAIGDGSPLPLEAPNSTLPQGATAADGPYVTLANACYPFTLPFNEPIAVARTYLQWMGTSRYEVLNTLQTNPAAAAAAAAAIDAEYLRLDPYLYQLLTGETITGQSSPPPLSAALYGETSTSGWETTLASVPTFLQQSGIQATDLIAVLQTRFGNPDYPLGPDATFFNQLPFEYPTLMTLVAAGFNIADPRVQAADPTIADDLVTAGIDAAAITAWQASTNPSPTMVTASVQDWWQRNPNLDQTLVIYCPEGSCDLTDASISQLNGLTSATPPVSATTFPSPAPPSEAGFDTLQLFIRLWRLLGWSMADLDRAFTALGVTPITSSTTVGGTSGTAVTIPPAFIHDLARINQLQATLTPATLQVLFALWGDLDPNGDDSLYLQLFVNPAALPNDPAFAPQPGGEVLQDLTQTITGHLPALVAGLQVSAGGLAAIRVDAGLFDQTPAAGDVIVGGALPTSTTLISVSGSGPYTVATSATIPAGTDVTFAGGPSGVWVGAGSPVGANQMSLTLTGGSAPHVGDFVLGVTLASPLRITAVTGAGPYELTTSAAFSAAGTFAGGPPGTWAGTASPAGGSNTMSLTIAPWPLTLPNVSELYRYAALAQALGMSVADFITIKTLGAVDPFASPDATSAFVTVAQQVRQSNFTATQLAYLYQDVSAPPTGLAPQATTLQLLAKPLRDGLAQIATQCQPAPDPKGTLTASTLTQVISKTVATQTVALINGTAVYTTPLSALPLVYAWIATASPTGGGNQMTVVLSTGSAPQAGDTVVGGGETFTLTAVSIAGYTVTASQIIPASSAVAFAGGPNDAWLGTASPTGTAQMTLTVTAGIAPQIGDTIVGSGLTQPCTVSAVSGTGPYAITVSQAIPAGTNVTFAGGPNGAWLATASPTGTTQATLTLNTGPVPQIGDTIVGGGLAATTLVAVAPSGYMVTAKQAIPAGANVTYSGGNIAKIGAGGQIVGFDPTRTPTAVGAKLSYDPTTGTLSYRGAMTSQEQIDLLALCTDTQWQAAIGLLYAQPATFVADNLAPLLNDSNANSLLLANTSSLDGNLNPVLVDSSGNAQTDAALVTNTAIAWKFAYLLSKLLPYLQNTLSHTLVKQTIADTFTLDATLTSLLLEQVLTAPGATASPLTSPLITDLLALTTSGVTATYYSTPDLSGPPSAPPATAAATSFAVTLPAGTQSARFAAWLEVPSSTTYTFTISVAQTASPASWVSTGKPLLFVGDPANQVTVQADPATAGSYITANSVALTAGGFAYIELQIPGIPSSPQATVTLRWQSPSTQTAPGTASAASSPQGASIPNAPIPGSVLLPEDVYRTFGSAYIRIQKAALLANQFALTASEITYLTAAGAAAPPLFAGFDLNALPITPGVTVSSGSATALFDVWLRLYTYTALRNSLPNGSVTLIDLFSATTFSAAADLVPQVTGWSSQVVTELLSAYFPTPPTANPLVDEITLTSMQACANLVGQVSASPAQLFSWAQYTWTNTPPTTQQEASYAGLHAIAAEIQNAAASNYNVQAWPGVAEQLNNTLRGARRDALVSYLMGQLGFTDPDDLFDLLLIDAQMGTCMQTSRIRQALNSVQLFVQRCLLGLEINENNSAVSIQPSQIDATTWRTWMGTYSIWAANREVFLWPENWLLPSLRDDQTEIFQAFASSLQQATITDDTVSAAFLAYLQGLEQIARLDIRCVFWQGAEPYVQGSSVGVLHVFARTWHDAKTYFYRQLIASGAISQTWTPWQQVSAGIQGDYVVPVFWEGRMRLFWPVFTQQSYTPSPSGGTLTATSSNGSTNVNTGSAPQTYWQITLAWSDLYQGTWSPKQVSTDFLASVCYGQGSYDQPPKEVHVFKARIDNNTDLVVDVYVPINLTGDLYNPNWNISLGEGPVLLGEFRFCACGNTITVGYNMGNLDGSIGGFWVSPPDIDPSPNLSTSQPSSSQLPYGAQLLSVPYADPYNNGARQETDSGTPQILQLQTGGFGDNPWSINQWNAPASTPVTFLSMTPSRFELRYSQQNWQFALQEPFFYQDAQHTFFVAPGVNEWTFIWFSDADQIDPRKTLLSLAGMSYTPPPPVTNPNVPAPSALAAQVTAVPATEAHLNAEFADTAQVLSLTSGSGRSTTVGYTQPPSTNWHVSDSFEGGWVRWSWSSFGLFFQTHRHPYVCTLIEDLVAAEGQDPSGGGISGLLNLANQKQPDSLNFINTYFSGPSDPNLLFNIVTPTLPTETVDFTPTGAYSGYNWELFFHAPLLVALTLSQNGQYEDADTWFRYIFDPTNPTTSATSPQPYWQVQPFTTSAPETLVQLMNDIDNNAPDAVAQVADWYSNPFQPFVIARSRIGAFQKYVFMAYLDNLIAWGDQLYGQVDSIESINQATQLYVFASQLLGELPEQIPSPQSPIEYDYNSIQGKLDAFSNFSEMLENEFPFAGPVPSTPQTQASGLLGLSKTLFFCIPQNQQLLGYWSTVASRLYNIRHCLNIQGVPQQLALFQPPANPLLLIEAEAEGIDPGSVLADVNAPLPNYRFSYLIQRAADLASTCQAFGRSLLEALEKNDAEGLALLRATQETQILNLMTDMKQQQVNEAQANVAALSASRTVALTRYNFYQLLLGADSPATPAVGANIQPATVPTESPISTGGVTLLNEENSELSLSNEAALLHAGAGLLQMLGSIFAIIPTFGVNVDVMPFGIGASGSISFGGSNLASEVEFLVHGMETLANYLTYQAWSAGKMGGYFRRQQDWTLQNNLAAADIMQIDQQTQAANIRVAIANDDLKTHTQQAANAQAMQDYLTGKFTNQQLYSWMVSQLSSLYSQLYQLAYSTAKLAEIAYQRELSVPDSSYVTFGYWDSSRKGLLAGERLQLAVKQLERAYIDQNEREFEITRHVSLLLHDPAALIALKTTGECIITLPEALFDTDYPGHYLRRLRDVSLTIPLVAGPYTPINCTLTLVSSKIRFDPSTGNSSSASYAEQPGNQDSRFIYNFGSTAAIATSHGQDDSGVFSLNFRDERYLPFETAGAISTWMISMPPGCNAFDFDTITDVILKLSYTARYGGDLLRSQAYTAAVLPAPTQQTAAPNLGAGPKQTAQNRLFSLKHEFPSEWYGLLHPASASADYGQMPVWTVTDRFPFQYRTRKVRVTGIAAFALLKAGVTAPNSLSIYLANAALPTPAGTSPTPPSDPGAQISLKPDTLYSTSTLYGIMPTPASPVDVPNLWWLAIGRANLSTVLDSVEDFFLLMQYSVT
jgi:hypothetical protein